MITRNRGKSKSVVETLGLVKKNRRRIWRNRVLADTSKPSLPIAHEETVSGNRDCGNNLSMTPNGDGSCRCAQEAEVLCSVETTPAKWSFSSTGLGASKIDQTAFSKCEGGLGALHKVPGYDWLPPKGMHSFQLYDEVLREILEEISTAGEVFTSRRQFAKCKLRKSELNEKEEKVVYGFGEAKLKELFDKMSADLEAINEELDKEEEFLASCGLVRPGVARALRKRRLERCKQTKHKAIGRLRPNPRPRRFSDMVNPNAEVAERLTGLSRNAKRVRDR
ncbi:unnamed protein product, partial [Hydatigera taeniaeformis]|uniref:Uncharacterized protein n=1 Tax=Hydatigena taeniaeformis TaxID=6205 RepID=A0A0R3WYQ7_HYDTA